MRTAIYTLAFLIATSATSTPAAEAVDKPSDVPSIILIVADDLGWAGLGCYGSSYYETPHIDKLAREGVKFTSAYAAASTCAPSRASIMSGQYTPRHGILYVGSGTFQQKWKKNKGDLKRFKMIQPQGETDLDPSLETLGAALKRGGYRTAMFGKWHLGTGDFHPSKRGFDVAIESHGKHFNFHTTPETPHQDGAYLSDFLSDQAAEFIKETSAAGDRPFFLYYADFLVHKPLETKQKLLRHFSAKEPSEHQKSPVAGAMIKALDDSVGKILAALDQSGRAENTLVVFVSDNGGLSYAEDGVRDQNTSNLPLRGRKGSEYDGGLRIPWIVKWPGHIPENRSCDSPVNHVDLFPTLLEAGRTEVPEGQLLDGISLLPLFRHPEAEMKNRTLFWYLPGYSSFHTPSVMARRGQWKMIRRLESDEYFLYQTDKDISESKDRALMNSRIGETLNQEAMDWLKKINAPLMKPNPEYDPSAK